MNEYRYFRHKWVALPLTMVFLSSCGTSLFVKAEKKDAKEDATLELEKNNPDAAISLLNKALAKDPGNPRLLALLSSATAQKYGIDTITIALQMSKNSGKSASASSSSTASGSSNGITLLFSALPAATDDRIAGVQSAISIMESIAAADRTPADNFLLTMMHTSVIGLTAKQFDTDGDGLLSPVEMLSFKPEAAIAILAGLLGAQEAMALGTGATGTSSSAALAMVSKIQTAINESPGENDQEKLMNYFNASATKVMTTATVTATDTTTDTSTIPSTDTATIPSTATATGTAL